jgi:hypothetical protein
VRERGADPEGRDREEEDKMGAALRKTPQVLDHHSFFNPIDYVSGPMLVGARVQWCKPGSRRYRLRALPFAR